jgi:hypothetical protein
MLFQYLNYLKILKALNSNNFRCFFEFLVNFDDFDKILHYLRKHFIDHIVINESFDSINFIIIYFSAKGRALFSLSIELV